MKNWEYSSYRAILTHKGQFFALVTPNGHDTLDNNKALVNQLNAADKLREAYKPIDIVAKINGELFEKFGEPQDFFPSLAYKTDGTSELITFGGVLVWDTEDLNVPYDEANSCEGDLEKYIRAKMIEVVQMFGKSLSP